MSDAGNKQPLVRVEYVDEINETSAVTPRTGDARPEASEAVAPALIGIETLETAEPVQPEAERPSPTDARERTDRATSGGWLIWAAAGGVAALALIGTVEWVVSLVLRFPLLGAPAAAGAALFVIGLGGLGWREVAALRRLRDVKGVREEVMTADGDRLRTLLLRIGSDAGATPVAQRAANSVENQGPDAARRILSREALAPLDRRAAQAVGDAARQGFVLVTASPSPALDSALLMMRAALLVRDIASIYGYRPSVLALRSLAFAAGRDAGTLAVANALAEAAADATARSLAQVGDGAVAAGVTMTAASGGAGALVGLPLAAAGAGLSLLGRTVGTAGGAVGGGAAAAWRLYRFGLMVLVAARPLPFDRSELDDLSQEARREVMRLSRRQDAPAGKQAASPA